VTWGFRLRVEGIGYGTHPSSPPSSMTPSTERPMMAKVTTSAATRMAPSLPNLNAVVALRKPPPSSVGSRGVGLGLRVEGLGFRV
jgi:hypothetical protein